MAPWLIDLGQPGPVSGSCEQQMVFVQGAMSAGSRIGRTSAVVPRDSGPGCPRPRPDRPLIPVDEDDWPRCCEVSGHVEGVVMQFIGGGSQQEYVERTRGLDPSRCLAAVCGGL